MGLCMKITISILFAFLFGSFSFQTQLRKMMFYVNYMKNLEERRKDFLLLHYSNCYIDCF